jgi:hypothetical protein
MNVSDAQAARNEATDDMGGSKLSRAQEIKHVSAKRHRSTSKIKGLIERTKALDKRDKGDRQKGQRRSTKLADFIPQWRSTASTLSTPAFSSMMATSEAEIGTLATIFLSCWSIQQDSEKRESKFNMYGDVFSSG